jgi:hypothetical protein
MKFKIIYTSFAMLLTSALFLGNSNGRAAGGGGDNTGGPQSGGTCGSCHAGGAYNPSLQVTFLDNASNVVTSWLPNQTYTVRVKVVAGAGAPVGYGFQMIPYDAAANSVPFAATGHSANVQISTLGGRKYAEHNTRSATNTFDVKWTAPAAGAGAVQFYVAGNAVNGVNGTSGDSPVNVRVPLNEGRVATNDLTLKAAAMQVSPNPASEQTEIRLTVSEAQNATISVVDMAGRVLQTQKWAVVAGENRQSLQVSDLATGLYVVRVAHTGGVSHQQLLKK